MNYYSKIEKMETHNTNRENLMIEAYPLCWPEGHKKITQNDCRESSQFKSTFAKAVKDLLHEVDLLRGRYFYGNDPILSTNVELRKDGLPYANRLQPEDPGVAIYFEYKKQQMCFACDKWKKVWENIVSIRKTIEAIRGIERWGSSDMMERAFSGFTQLENLSDKAARPWWSVLGVSEHSSSSEIITAFKRRRSETHPDKGGDENEFNLVQQAYKTACA